MAAGRPQEKGQGLVLRGARPATSAEEGVGGPRWLMFQLLHRGPHCLRLPQSIMLLLLSET
jgi:hypothetical protein